jgi:hypothetical protein
MDITSAETKATYDEIKKYVAEHNDGMKDSSLYISQIKKKCGIEVGKNYNLKEILYLIFNYPHKHYTFKHFEV